MSRFVADDLDSTTVTTMAMKVLGLAKNVGRWFSARLAPSPSPLPPHSINRYIDLLDDVFEDIAYRRMCGLGLVRPTTPEPTVDEDDDWVVVDDPIRAIFAPPRPLRLLDHHHPRRESRRRRRPRRHGPSRPQQGQEEEEEEQEDEGHEAARATPDGRCCRRHQEDAFGQAPHLAPRWGDLMRVTFGRE